MSKEGRSLLGLVALLLSPFAAYPQRGLLKNGDFEGEAIEWLPEATTTKRVLDPMAHSGRFSMRGEVRRPNRAKFLVYPMRFDRTKLYRVALWARSSNHNKLVLWIRVGDKRVWIATWLRVPKGWKRYEASFSLPKSGPRRVEIVALSFGGPLGVMWVDDVQIYELSLPPRWNLTGGDGLCDFPVVAMDGTGRLYVAWTRFTCDPRSREEFMVIRPRMLLRFAVVDPREVEVSSLWGLSPPKAFEVPLPRGAVLLWAMEVKGNWDIWGAKLGLEEASKPARITSLNSTEIKPTGCLDGAERLWVAFEGNEGGWRGIYVLSLDPVTPKPEGPCPRPRRLSLPRTSNYNPSIAANSRGVWVVFHARFDGGGWSPERRLTSSPLVEHCLHLAVSPDGRVWMVWELGLIPGYRTTLFNRKEVRVARLDPEGLKAPLALPEALSNWCEFPTLSFDRAGRLWLCVRHAINPNKGWETWLFCYSGGEWKSPIYVVPKQGRSRRAWALPLPSGRGVVVLSQADTMPGSWGQKNLTQRWESNIFLARVDASEAPPPAPLKVRNYSEVERKDEAKFEMPSLTLRRAMREDAPRSHIDFRGRRLYLFWGNFHAHSSISVCIRRGDIRPDLNYAHMRDINRYDFAALTDHGYNIDPYIWTLMGIWARSNCDSGSTKEHPFGYYGHRNLIFVDPYFLKWFNAWDGSTPRRVWEILWDMGADFVHIPHQLADNGNVPIDWNFHDERAQPVAEIFQARGSYEYRGAPRQARNVVPGDGYFLREAWERGVVIGVIASPDHGGGLGKAAVFATDLSREAIFKAIRERHTYGTTAAKIFVDFRVDGHLMGEKFERPPQKKPIRIGVRAVGANTIARVRGKSPSPSLTPNWTSLVWVIPKGQGG